MIHRSIHISTSHGVQDGVAIRHGRKFSAVVAASTNTESSYTVREFQGCGARQDISIMFQQIDISYVWQSNDASIANVTSTWLVTLFRVASRQAPIKFNSVTALYTNIHSS